jgi:hypothetical protein
MSIVLEDDDEDDLLRNIDLPVIQTQQTKLVDCNNNQCDCVNG